MTEHAKSNVCLAVKEKSSSLDMVHTRPDGMLSNKRSTKTSASGRFTLEAEKQKEICKKIIFPNVSFSTHMYK
jgi:hypothetical protein